MTINGWFQGRTWDLYNLLSKKEVESKGEEQIKVNNETFERETQESLCNIIYNQNLIYENQKEDREKLKRLDEKLTEVVKMIMDVKDKL